MNITRELLVKNGFKDLNGFMGELFRFEKDYHNTYLSSFGDGTYLFHCCRGGTLNVEREISTMEELQLCLDFCGFFNKLIF